MVSLSKACFVREVVTRAGGGNHMQGGGNHLQGGGKHLPAAALNRKTSPLSQLWFIKKYD